MNSGNGKAVQDVGNLRHDALSGGFMAYHAYGVFSQLDGLVAVRLKKREAINYVRARHQRAVENGYVGDCTVHPVQIQVGQSLDLDDVKVIEIERKNGKKATKVVPAGTPSDNILLPGRSIQQQLISSSD